MLKKHDSYEAIKDFDNDLAASHHLEYSTELEKKSKADTIDARENVQIEPPSNPIICNMIVAVRLRPISNKEIERNEFEIVKILDK